MFKAYRHGTFDNVKQKLCALDEMPANGVKKSLSLLELQERQNKILAYCLEQGGFSYERSFRWEADGVDPQKERETFEVLEESPFRQHVPRVVSKTGGRVGASPGVEAVFDKEGRLPVNW